MDKIWMIKISLRISLWAWSPSRVNGRSVDSNRIQNSPTSRFKFCSNILNKETNYHKYWLCSYLFVKNAIKIKISGSQRISNRLCMNYDHNKKFGLFKFHSGYRKFFLHSPKGYSRKIINAVIKSLCISKYLTWSLWLWINKVQLYVFYIMEERLKKPTQ